MADLPITSDNGAMPIIINDPTTVANVANVKAASTASVAGDNSLVVALSPNSPVPTGTNNIGVTGVAQGSTTSGEHGDLIQGAVTTAAPAYTTGQTSPLSLDTSGNLRVTSTSDSDKNITGTITALNGNVVINTQGMASLVFTLTGTWVATIGFQGFDGTNWITASGLTIPAGGITEALASNGSVLLNCGGFSQVRLIATAFTSGTVNVFMNAGAGTSLVEIYNDSQNPIIVSGHDQSGTGTITALNGTVVATTTGCSAVSFNITGTWVATLTVQATSDGINWNIVNCNILATDITTQTFANNEFLVVPCGGFQQVRLIATAFTSGTVNVAWNSGAGTSPVLTSISPVAASFNVQASGAVTTAVPTYVTGTVEPLSLDTSGNLRVTVISGTVTDNQGTPNTIANAWPIKITDGTDVVNVNADGSLSVEQKPAILSVTATAATRVAVTATLPAVAADFHYMTMIEIVKYATAAITGTATPVLVTTTNFPAANVFTFGTAQAVGTTLSYLYAPALPIRSAVLNTATTIVCPATTSVIWRVNVYYYTGV